MDEKYTPLGLPVIFKDVISTSLRDETEYSDSNNFVKQKYDNLRKVLASENPILLDYVNVGLNTAPNEAAAEAFIFGFYSCYSLLRRQLEVNRLEEELR